MKLETDFTKTWTLNSSSQLVAHLNGGYVWCYGNSTQAPNSELFYMGGANSVRAFSVRGVGPGDVESFGDRATDYLMRNGNLKLLGIYMEHCSWMPVMCGIPLKALRDISR